MAGTTKELRVWKCPIELHNKIEIHKALVRAKEGRRLTKEDAVIELLYKATKQIKLVAS